MPKRQLVEKILALKAERGAIILAHNYQPPEIQDVADRLGDSLDLSRFAASAREQIIVFCGVHFMAETAAILSPEKKIILPEPAAGCPMADMLCADDLVALKKKHPGAVVVTYVNSSAEVKAETDICCTSANAIRVIQTVPEGVSIIFGPDRYLGGWVAAQTGRSMILWQGYCPTHQKIHPEHIEEQRRLHPGAVVMVHPEVNPTVASLADAVLGTGGMIAYVEKSPVREFIVGTETGMVYRLQRKFPDREFFAATKHALCPNMKKITLEKVAQSLESLGPAVAVEPGVAARARRAIRAMIEIS
ncbi:MAG: quinolinate synthase NadA [Candidatus Krumholzibacteria bacterium]|nr:quinolinate synthase NadA [Candidatus Krumholzibacteria bacterium]